MNIRSVTHADRLVGFRTLVTCLLCLSAAAALWSPRSPAQEAATAPLTADELETLVGPIALYPDEVLAIVLPASTYPLEIVQAARFLDEAQSNRNSEPDERWDDSVVALLNYPDVVRLLNEDLDWTWALGEAVLDDQAAVLDAIQTFRDRAYDAGNLVSDDRQVVTEDGGAIAIAPADPEVVYIPYYEPTAVVVYQPRPVFHYYPHAYPLYYYPYPAGYHFSTGYFWGVTSAFVIGWDSHFIHLHHHTHYRHPFYRRTYYTPFYNRQHVNVTINVNNYRNVWNPRRVRGARPYDGVRAVRNGDRVYRSYEGRRYRYAGDANANTRRSDPRVDSRVQPRVRDERGTSRATANLPRQGTVRTSPERTYRSGTARPETNRNPGAVQRGATDPRRNTVGGVAPDRSARTDRSRSDRNITERNGANRALPNRTIQNRAAPNRSAPAGPTPDRRIIAGSSSRNSTPDRTAPQAARSTVRQAPVTRAPARAMPPQARTPAVSSGSRFGGVAQPSRQSAPPSRSTAPRGGGQTQRAGGGRARSVGTPSRQR